MSYFWYELLYANIHDITDVVLAGPMPARFYDVTGVIAID